MIYQVVMNGMPMQLLFILVKHIMIAMECFLGILLLDSVNVHKYRVYYRCYITLNILNATNNNKTNRSSVTLDGATGNRFNETGTWCVSGLS